MVLLLLSSHRDPLLIGFYGAQAQQKLDCVTWKDKLTFRPNPLIRYTISLPLMRLIIFWIVLSVCQVDDEAETRNGFNHIGYCVSGVKEERKLRWTSLQHKKGIFWISPFRTRKTFANVLHRERMRKERRNVNKLSHYVLQFCEGFFSPFTSACYSNRFKFLLT